MKSKAIKITLISAISSILYVCSYGFLQPILEKCGLDKVAYIIYEPVEFVRNKNDNIYLFLETLYKACGGDTPASERYFFATHRRVYREPFIANLRFTVSSWSCFLDGKEDKDTWYQYSHGGKHKLLYDNGILRSVSYFYPNGALATELKLDGDETIQDGVYRWSDYHGDLIAKCSFKDGQPLNGSWMYTLCWESDGTEVYNYLDILLNTDDLKLGTFHDGKKIKESKIVIFAYGSFSILP